MTRSGVIKMIHVGCRELGIDGDARHDMQLIATGKASLRDMSDGELRVILDQLKARGFKATGRRPAAPRADLRYVHVLWSLLGEAGVLTAPGRTGLNAFVRARFGATWGAVPADIDMLRGHREIRDVIEALKEWCLREGVAVDHVEARK